MIFNLSETNVGGGGETDTILGLRIRTYEDINPDEEMSGSFDFELPEDEYICGALCLAEFKSEGYQIVIGAGGIEHYIDSHGAYVHTTDFDFIFEGTRLDDMGMQAYLNQGGGSGSTNCQFIWDDCSAGYDFTPHKLIIFTKSLG